MRLQHESFVYIVNLCRVIVANYSRTSLRLSQSSEIGAVGVTTMIVGDCPISNFKLFGLSTHNMSIDRLIKTNA